MWSVFNNVFDKSNCTALQNCLLQTLMEEWFEQQNIPYWIAFYTYFEGNNSLYYIQLYTYMNINVCSCIYIFDIKYLCIIEYFYGTAWYCTSK